MSALTTGDSADLPFHVNRFLADLLECVAEGVVAADLEGRFVLFNSSAQRMLGLGPHDVPSAQRTATYGIFLEDTVTRFPPDQVPLARAIRGETVTDCLGTHPEPESPGWSLDQRQRHPASRQRRCALRRRRGVPRGDRRAAHGRADAASVSRRRTDCGRGDDHRPAGRHRVCESRGREDDRLPARRTDREDAEGAEVRPPHGGRLRRHLGHAAEGRRVPGHAHQPQEDRRRDLLLRADDHPDS